MHFAPASLSLFRIRMRATLVIALACTAGCGVLVGVSTPDAERAMATKDYDTLKHICTRSWKVKDQGYENPQTETKACEAFIPLAASRGELKSMQGWCLALHTTPGGVDEACRLAALDDAKRNDRAALDAVCSDAKYEPACKIAVDAAIQAGDVARLATLCEQGQSVRACIASSLRKSIGDLAHPDCARIVDATLAAEKADAPWTKPLAGEGSADYLLAPYIVALMKCGQEAYFFEEIMHAGGTVDDMIGKNLIEAAEAVDAPAVLAGFERYVSSHRGPRFLGEHALHSSHQISAWLLHKNHLGYCDMLAQAADGSSLGSIDGLIGYFQAVHCTAAVPVIASLLRADDPTARAEGCTGLVGLGGPAAAAQVKIVADTDQSYNVVTSDTGEAVKDYFVARACSDAYGQMALAPAQDAAAPPPAASASKKTRTTPRKKRH